jgi:putative NADH-flavin reductase
MAGITGMCGQPLALAALEKGHQVRGLARNPDKMDKGLLSKLESFVKLQDIYDLAALQRAVDGVDAIVCAYPPHQEVVVEGQLLLLRAAERANVKVVSQSLLQV